MECSRAIAERPGEVTPEVLRIGVIRLARPCEREGQQEAGPHRPAPSLPKGGLAMRKLLIALAALTAAALTATLGFGSSHREAPGISQDPTADNTDTYAWTAKDAPGDLTVAANWIPGEVPANGPNFFGWDDRARYYVHIDNTGDGRPDVSYRFRFKTKVRNKESFLYALPGASGYRDSKLNVIQRYSIDRVTYRGKARREHAKTVARGLPVAPPNIGPKTFAN